MYAVNIIPSAVAQVTGEQLQAARLRMIASESWARLVPAAGSKQALFESLFQGALGVRAGRRHPFGILAAVPAAGRLELYLEDDSCAEPQLELLPYRDRRGTWRGVRGLSVRPERRSLHFTLPAYRSHVYASPVQRPVVVVHAQRESRLSVLLDRHRQRLENAGGRPQWESDQAVPRRREPLSRNVPEQHAAACQLASALLRRPRVWDALAGHVGVTAAPALADHGLDWIIERTVGVGGSLHDERLIEVLTERVAGPGLHLLSHECSEAVGTAQWVSGERREGWDGLLTVHTRSVDSTSGRSPRPLLVLGEPLLPGRPDRNGYIRPQVSQPPAGRIVGLISLAHVPNAVGSDELLTVATELGAVWALQGLRVAVLTITASERPFFLGHGGRARSATKSLPWAAGPQWTRLRVDPSPGQL